jgi:hypothetical protein
LEGFYQLLQFIMVSIFWCIEIVEPSRKVSFRVWRESKETMIGKDPINIYVL